MTPIKTVVTTDRRGRRSTRHLCSYGGHLHVSHRQAMACNVRMRAAEQRRRDRDDRYAYDHPEE